MEKIISPTIPIRNSEPLKVQVSFRGHPLNFTEGAYEILLPFSETKPSHHAVTSEVLLKLFALLLDLRSSPAKKRAEDLLRELCDKIDIEKPRVILPS